MTDKKPAGLLQPIEPFFWGQRFVAQDEIVTVDDPVVKGRVHLFKADEVATATAAPGSARSRWCGSGGGCGFRACRSGGIEGLRRYGAQRMSTSGYSLRSFSTSTRPM